MIMLHQSLSIRLIDDCVFSERSATEGAHDTLDRVPGSALLGAAAAQLYSLLPVDVSDLVFHSGRVRFSDAFPCQGSHCIAWPVPLCWHFPKSNKPAGPGVEASLIHNFQHVDAIRGPSGGTEQAKQLREGYISADGRWIKPERGYRMKTAVDGTTGRAADGQLFGYSSLSRGQTFVSFVEADEDVDPALFEQVCAALRGVVFLGRSRSAEYGRAEIERFEDDLRPVHGSAENGVLTLWLLSDLAPCDAMGRPTNTLDVQCLGLPNGSRIDWSRSFLRSRSYSAWNATRKGYEVERKVIRAGSVITASLPSGADVRATIRQLARGVGLHVQSGLGRVWVNPPMLAGAHPAFSPAIQSPQEPSLATMPKSALARWLCEQVETDASTLEQRVVAIAADYRQLTDAVRRNLGLPEHATDMFPSRSQWGSVLEVARFKAGKDLYRALFEGDGAVIKASSKGWSLEVPKSGERVNWIVLADWIKERIGNNGDCEEELVQRLARRLMDEPNRRKG